MRTLVLTTSTVRLLLTLVPFAAFGPITTHAQVPGAALTTAQAEVIGVPPAPLQDQGGLDDQAIASCIGVQSARVASE